MRHQKAGRTLGRKAAHRHALFSNLVAALVKAERIRTTDAKAKELKRLAERTITWGTSLGDLLTREPDALSADEKAKVVHHMRMARRVLKEPEALAKLFREIAPRYLGRPGGYTRVLKIGHRVGDAAPMSIVELLPAPVTAQPEPEAEEPKGKGKAKAAAAEEKPAKAAKAKKTVAPKAAAEPAEKKPRKRTKKTEE
jgi:large subunit ribosomal protein L17